MPSQLHEALLLLFRNRPQLAAELLREALHVELPPYERATIESAELTDIQPAEYRADLVVSLRGRKAALGIVVEAQLQTNEDKRYSWPVYVANLRARLKCPVCLLVVTPREAVARWARRPIDLGGGNRFQPLVIGPSGVPEIADEQQARSDPELAVLSALAHGRDPDSEKVKRIAQAAMAASIGLDVQRSTLYFDLVWQALNPAVRKALQSMETGKYEYQSEFARRYVAEGEAKGKAEGRAEGEAKGKAELLMKLLTLRFGPLSEETLVRLRSATGEEMELFAERVLAARSLDEIFD